MLSQSYLAELRRYLVELGRYPLQKGRAYLADWLRQLLAQPGPAGLVQKLTVEKRYRINIGRPDRIVILLVGCGGTGSACAPILAQLAHWARRSGLELRLTFVDPDTVEEKNLVRQNFCPAEVGAPKAMSLAWRYTAAFGQPIRPRVEPFSAGLLEAGTGRPGSRLTIVIGAVDNVEARREIARAVTARLEARPDSQEQIWWIDAGNDRVSGQVVAGNSLELEPLLSPLGFCVGVPLPHLQEPGLLRPRPARAQPAAGCAELNLLGEQSAAINRAMAGWVGVYLFRLLQSRDLDLMSTWVNLQSGTTRSRPITTGRVVTPPLPQRVPAQPAAPLCPYCETGQVLETYDTWLGVMIRVQFCDQCEEQFLAGCPVCWEEIEQDWIEREEGEVVPILRCQDRACDWQAVVPPEFRADLERA